MKEKHVNKFGGKEMIYFKATIRRGIFLKILIGWSLVAVKVSFVQAAALPSGTVLTLDPQPSGGWCQVSTCWIPEVAPGLDVGVNIYPGTDGGFVIGKNQLPGGQQNAGGGANPAAGELTASHFFFGQYGSFATAPFVGATAGKVTTDASLNKFDSNSCLNTACIGKTELASWHWAWNETAVPMGSALGCQAYDPWQCRGVTNWTVNPDGTYRLSYSWTIPLNDPTNFAGMTVHFSLNGRIVLPPAPVAPTVGNVRVDAPPGMVAVWTPDVFDYSGAPVSCRLLDAPQNGIAEIASDCASGTYRPNADSPGTDSFSYVASNGFFDSNPGSVKVTADSPVRLVVAPVAVSGDTGTLMTWTPAVTSNVTTSSPTCTIKTPPMNGTATVGSACAAGTYQSKPGFVGTDEFVYEAMLCTDQCYRSSATVTVAVTEPPPSDPCLAQYPVSQFTHTGKEGTLTITFTGNITSHTNKEVKVCPGTTLSYIASSTKDVVKCKVKNNLSSGSGTLRIRDHLKCTDKPGGKDKIQLKVKSGVK